MIVVVILRRIPFKEGMPDSQWYLKNLNLINSVKENVNFQLEQSLVLIISSFISEEKIHT